jgi:hypothetical protein
MDVLPRDIIICIFGRFLNLSDVHAVHQTSSKMRDKTRIHLIEFKEWVVPSREVTRLSEIDRTHIRNVLFYPCRQHSRIKLPPCTKKLTIQHTADQLELVPGIIPTSVTHLAFGHMFNQPIGTGVIPVGVTHITFGWNFNRRLFRGVISSCVTLTHLTFGTRFNQKCVLPPNVTHLIRTPI